MTQPIDGAQINPLADGQLASYAQKNAATLGRQHPERVDPNRTPFQRDRDRIIHTTAFRRLKGKMQVVSPNAGDHFRNRLTHTIEVTQIARDLARQLQLNEDLAEAIALAHDLGHPPFGHAGETALDEMMQTHDRRFEHNAQSLRVVDFFEPRYKEFPGLNLTQEVREGMQKHNTFFDRPHSEKNPRIFSPHLESQVVDISDAIAYLSADLEDGLRGGFFTLQDLTQVGIMQNVLEAVPKAEHTFRPSLVRGLMRYLIAHLIHSSKENLVKNNIQTLADVQQTPDKLIAFAPEVFGQFRELKTFLRDEFYWSPPIKAMTEEGQEKVKSLFTFLEKNPRKISNYDSGQELYPQICDFIAGMTDRFAESFWQDQVGRVKW